MVPRRFQRAHLGDQAALRLPHPQPPGAAGAGCEPGLARALGARCRRSCTKPRRLLLGRHDFTTFRAAECQANSPIRTLDRLDVERIGEEIRIYASARSFLHHQVRSMVGTLERAGAGRWAVADVRAALDARDRTRCGPMAPSAGLYLIGVDYPGLNQHDAGSHGADEDVEHQCRG